ncbi:hypothetical protein G9A89_020543 [Geosiphon pyriformis]|nr:hypothetical protein G9A89_020543 [Geosiphon pyriformis]
MLNFTDEDKKFFLPENQLTKFDSVKDFSKPSLINDSENMEENDPSLDRICNKLQSLLNQAQEALHTPIIEDRDKQIILIKGSRARSGSLASSSSSSSSDSGETVYSDETLSSPCSCGTCPKCALSKLCSKKLQVKDEIFENDQEFSNPPTMSPKLEIAYRRSCENLENEFRRFLCTALESNDAVEIVDYEKTCIWQNITQNNVNLSNWNLEIPKKRQNKQQAFIEKQESKNEHGEDQSHIRANLCCNWKRALVLAGFVMGIAQIIKANRSNDTANGFATRKTKTNKSLKCIVTIFKYLCAVGIGWSIGKF